MTIFFVCLRMCACVYEKVFFIKPKKILKNRGKIGNKEEEGRKKGLKNPPHAFFLVLEVTQDLANSFKNI